MPKESIIRTSVFEYNDIKACPSDIQQLMDKAVIAREKAYTPYSQFQVGAAIRLENGKIVTGSNQENASYPSGLCAERTAIFYAGAEYPDQKIKSIAITATGSEKENTEPVPPCGACRQAIAEYEQKQKSPIAVYFMGKSGQVKMVKSLLSLLPLAFSEQYLK
ncbi:MAG: cytidine deaminase [Bacteroidetes bacterium]|jgi:cytidine deaminase|nr:cytidine deaminase [Bacteroidota bacterium]